MSDATYVPALGHDRLTPFYDRALHFATREATWRGAFVDQIAPEAGDTILDVGCGTGTLAIQLAKRAPDARIVGIDPDPAALQIAQAKAVQAGVEVEWQRGFARDAAAALGSARASKVVSSLVFHQVPLPEKRDGLAAMFRAARPGGTIHVADYARQSTTIMRMLFTIIGRLDGFDNTRPNANGVIERLLEEFAGFPVAARRVVPTPTGAISLFACRRDERAIA
jgi:ubiquinone/menaquinone biosynthesis C-methylase UbiE